MRVSTTNVMFFLNSKRADGSALSYVILICTSWPEASPVRDTLWMCKLGFVLHAYLFSKLDAMLISYI